MAAGERRVDAGRTAGGPAPSTGSRPRLVLLVFTCAGTGRHPASLASPSDREPRRGTLPTSERDLSVKHTRTGRLAALLAAGALALTACSDADQTGSAVSDSELTGTLAGAGASSQTAAMEAWIAGFQGSNPDVTVNYDSVGSGAGREQFIAGGVAFAGSDAALDDEELAAATQRCGGQAPLELPLYASPIALAYNLPGVEELKLTAENAAKIFNQKITKWNDPALLKDNPGLPDLAITPVNRQDDSGTTENFTEYLKEAAPAAWPYEPDGVFPVKGGEAGDGTSGVVSAIKAGKGAIGYADASQVGDLGVAQVQVGNEFVELSAESAAAVVAKSPRLEGREEGDLALTLSRDEPGTYPVVLVSYTLACTTYEDPAQAALVKEFLAYVASSSGQRAAAEAAGAAPLSSSLRPDVQAAIESIVGE